MQTRGAYPIRREHRSIAQLALTSYGTWKLFTTGYSGNEDTPELSDIATDSPEEASTLEQVQATPAVADCLSRYIVHDEALASDHFQETSDRRDGNARMVVDSRTRFMVSGSESITISPFITTSDAIRRTEVNLVFDG